jgi:hypothetical protein
MSAEKGLPVREVVKITFRNTREILNTSGMDNLNRGRRGSRLTGCF